MLTTDDCENSALHGNALFKKEYHACELKHLSINGGWWLFKLNKGRVSTIYKQLIGEFYLVPDFSFNKGLESKLNEKLRNYRKRIKLWVNL